MHIVVSGDIMRESEPMVIEKNADKSIYKDGRFFGVMLTEYENN